MDERGSWLRASWRTGVILVLIFGIALFLRLYFVYPLAFPTFADSCSGGNIPVSGGSDSYYWHRALCYSFETGKDLGADPLLNYPLGMNNPRPPLFPWFSLLMGRLLSTLFADPWHAVFAVFLLSTGLFGALTVFPVYALTKEAFGRRAGIVAAFFVAVSAAHLQRSESTNADHDAFTLFFVVATFYFYLRALKTLTPRRWVDNWSRGSAIRTGVRSFFQENRKSVLYSLLAGLCVAVIALSWQGWAYVPVILLVWFVVELFLDRFRNQDTMGVTILFAVAMSVALLLAFPWYFGRAQIRVWFDVPAYLFLVALALGFVFTVTRDYPWTLVIPSVFIAGGAALVVGIVVNPALAEAFVSGAGYFVQTKVYETIAEAQAPGMSQLILSFGWFAFVASLGAVAYLLWQIPRRREPSYTLIVIWAFAAIFMAISAARFIFSASPAFAVTAAFAVDRILVWADFAGMRRTFRSLAEGSWRNAFRKSVKIRHILVVLMLVFVTFWPVWYGIDAAIPFDLKQRYDRQVAEALPPFLRAPGYDAAGRGLFYFGAFGYGVPQPEDYFPAAWQWFSEQDADKPPEQRPAFLSWWDYGFEAVDRGKHPAVADNFQNGLWLAGQFITAQDEEQGTALLTVRVLEGHWRHNGLDFRPEVRAALERFDLVPDVFVSVFRNPSQVIPAIQSNPFEYGVWDARMQPQNAQYIFLTRLLTSRFDLEELVQLYRAAREVTGFDIGYFAIDSRLFPISATNTGIFYAPVKLSDHRVIDLPDGRVLPFEFFQILATTQRATDLPIQFVRPGDQITNQRIRYQSMFYESMFYRSYIGYGPGDLGFDLSKNPDVGIPGFSQALQSFPPVPGWNLTHWRVVYRTAYYNPFPDPANHTDAWRAVNYDEAQKLQEDIQAGRATGVVDLSTQTSVTNGIVFLRYYDGAWVNGTVRVGSDPVPGVWVTVQDELGTPHQVVKTDENGRFSAIVPFGEITLTASFGNLTPATLIGRPLGSITLPITLSQALRQSDWILNRDIEVPARTAQGLVYFDLNRNLAFDAPDAAVPQAKITVTHREFSFSRTATADRDGAYRIGPLVDGRYSVSVERDGRTFTPPDLDVTSADVRRDVSLPFLEMRGYATTAEGDPIAGAAVTILDETNRTPFVATADAAGFYSAKPLVLGDFTVNATAGDLASIPSRTRAFTREAWVNLTLRPSGTVVGTTRLFGTDLPFATLEFQHASDPGTIRIARSDASSRYEIRLQEGDWFVSGRHYEGATLFATLGRVSVRTGTATTFDPMFVLGVRVDGTVRDPSPTVQDPRARVSFLGDSGELWLTTGPTGGYLAFLPAGTYDVQAFNNAGARYLRTTLTGSGTLDLNLQATTESFEGTVFRDRNQDFVYTPGEEIRGARVDLVDDMGVRLSVTTNAVGEFRIAVFANRTYSGSIGAFGFQPIQFEAASPPDLRAQVPYILSPLPTTVQGSLLLDGAPLLRSGVPVLANGISGGALNATTTTDSNGGFALTLVPGEYELVVDVNVSSSADRRYQNRLTDRVVLPLGEASRLYDVAIVERTLIRGNMTIDGVSRAATLVFEGPDRRTIDASSDGFELYLQPGTYAVRANRTLDERVYAFMGTVTLTAANVTFPLSVTTEVTGLTRSVGTTVPGPLPIAFTRPDGASISVSTNAFGTYEAFLLPGTYAVSLDATASVTEGDIRRFYRYTFSGSLTVPTDVESLLFDLDLQRSFDNTTVRGAVSFDSGGVDATVSFLARGGGALNASAAASGTGAYAVGLAPGTYDVYVARSLGSMGFLSRVTIPHTGTHALNLALRPAFLLSGVTTDGTGARTSASVRIDAAARLDLTTDASGAFTVLLPSGTYTVTVTKSGTENGVPVQYRAIASVVLDRDRVANLLLEKLVSRSVSLTWDASQARTIAAGGSVVYTVVVRNTGNVADTFALSGRPGPWTFAFRPAQASLNFGTAGDSTTVEVTITSPRDALVDHGPIQVVATSTSDASVEGTAEVQIHILRTRGLALTVDPTTGVFDGSFLNYTVTVRNTGNARETVTVEVTNPNDLAAAGWIVNLGRLTGTASRPQVTDLIVEPNATAQVRLVARPTTGASGAPAALRVTAQDSIGVASTTVIVLSLPQLTGPGGIDVSGPDVFAQPPLNQTLLAIVLGIATAVAVGLVLTRRRR